MSLHLLPHLLYCLRIPPCLPLAFCKIPRHFACLLKIPESTEHLSLPVNADMGSGRFTSVVNLYVDDQLTSELVLRKDWISYYREYLISEGVMSLTIRAQNEQRSENTGAFVYSLVRAIETFNTSPPSHATISSSAHRNDQDQVKNKTISCAVRISALVI